MACGIEDDKGCRIAELEEEPYLTLVKNVNIKWKVRKPDYITEVGQHCKERGLRINKCSNMKKQKIKEELYKMFPLHQIDIKWLIEKEAQLLQALEAVAAEKRPAFAPLADDNDDPKNPAWHTHLPYLHLYCCLTEDDVRQHMASQFCVMDKAELSARNSNLQLPTYFELLAEKFNDASAPLLLKYCLSFIPCLWNPLSFPLRGCQAKQMLNRLRKRWLSAVQAWLL
jgi:hypothetical protein